MLAVPSTSDAKDVCRPIDADTCFCFEYRFTGLTAGECCAKCVQNTKCSAYTHNSAECILKDQTLVNSTNPDSRVCTSGQVRLVRNTVLQG